MSLLTEVSGYLVANVTAQDLVLGNNLFLNSKPDTPDIAVVLYETAAERPTDLYGTGAPAYEHRGMQVIARASAHAVAETLARDVWATLLLIVNETIGSTRYLRGEALQSPFPLQRDLKHRMEFACNYVFTVT